RLTIKKTVLSADCAGGTVFVLLWEYLSFPDAVVQVVFVCPAGQHMRTHSENQQQERQQDQQVAAQTANDKGYNEFCSSTSGAGKHEDSFCHRSQNRSASNDRQDNASQPAECSHPFGQPQQPEQQQQKEHAHFQPVNEVGGDAGNQCQNCRRNQCQFCATLPEQEAEHTQQQCRSQCCPVVPVLGVVGHGNQRVDVVQTEQSGENAGSERQFRLGRQVIPIFLQRNASFSQDTLIVIAIVIVYQFYAFLSNGRKFDKNVNFSKSLLTFSGNVLK
ncbi:MAG: hypothetical protein EGQ79_00325, partial [Ruminococcus sp.]|nr:hypothetical protein [Ruminococcus sp.]